MSTTRTRTALAAALLGTALAGGALAGPAAAEEIFEPSPAWTCFFTGDKLTSIEQSDVWMLKGINYDKARIPGTYLRQPGGVTLVLATRSGHPDLKPTAARCRALGKGIVMASRGVPAKTGADADAAAWLGLSRSAG